MVYAILSRFSPSRFARKGNAMDIWIVNQPQPCNLWDDTTQGSYLLVDVDYQPLLDATGKPYRCSSLAEAERRSCALLRPSVVSMARAWADRR